MFSSRRDQGAPARQGHPVAAVVPLARSSRARTRLRGEEGQSIVEFALVVPFIAMLVLALLGAGKLLLFWNNATQVANEGARLAAVNAGPTFPPGVGYDEYLTRQVLGAGSDASLRIRVQLDAVGTAPETKPGSAVTVYVCRTYNLPFFLPDLSIRGKATMRVERTLTQIAETGTCDS